jgi:hypothetical protein
MFSIKQRNFVHTSGNFLPAAARAGVSWRFRVAGSKKLKKPCFEQSFSGGLETLPENFYGRFVPLHADNMIPRRPHQVSKVH